MKAFRYLIAAALLPLAALAQSPPPTVPPDDSQKGASFESLDANGDGKISKEEAASNENVTANFAHYDVNGDGYIEKDEVVSANQGNPGQ